MFQIFPPDIFKIIVLSIWESFKESYEMISAESIWNNIFFPDRCLFKVLNANYWKRKQKQIKKQNVASYRIKSIFSVICTSDWKCFIWILKINLFIYLHVYTCVYAIILSSTLPALKVDDICRKNVRPLSSFPASLIWKSCNETKQQAKHFIDVPDELLTPVKMR